jgi:lipopolysaccharide/colanic/teichoic acid biosynthesis glycosyltransferase
MRTGSAEVTGQKRRLYAFPISSWLNGDGAVRRNGKGSADQVVLVEDGYAQAEQRALAAQRALNVVVAALLLVLALPVMLVIALLVKLTSRGPILFVQTRIGLDRRNGGRPGESCQRRVDYGGRPFRMYKFRTMYVEASRGDAEIWARPDDPRVTPLGRVLRKYRLDELPQLFNVLRGDMNLVGPRPEQPKIFDRLRSSVDRYPERQRVLPGITGRAQVRHHYDLSVDDVRRKLALDLEYIERRSVTEDLRIMFETVPTIIFRRGAW